MIVIGHSAAKPTTTRQIPANPPLVAVVPAEARKLLASYDARVRHLNVVLEGPRP